MNTQRILVLGGAFVAAIVVAFLVSHMLGGNTQTVKAAPPPPRIVTSEVLVAAADLSPGTQLTPASVRWQEWPKRNVDSSFFTEDANPDLSKVVAGAVVRAPLVSGEPLNSSKIVQHSQGAGFMAAVVAPGMRAISIPITTETGAGGFILPNDRVDVINTLQVPGAGHEFHARTILKDIRVLAVDQVFEEKDQKTVLAKTATLELAPSQAEAVTRAQASGTISLALRPLADSNPASVQAENDKQKSQTHAEIGEVSVIRYGVERQTTFGQKE